MNLALAFSDSVKCRPAKTALYWGEREYSYAELWFQSLSVGDHLQHQLHVKSGDRVGIWLKNCPEFIPALFGILAIGAVAVPINNFLKTEEVNFILQDAGINVLITDADLAPHFHSLHSARPELKLFKVEELSNHVTNGVTGSSSRLKTQVSKLKASDLAVLIYTSGTTRRPKGAMLSHANLLHNVESCRIVLKTVDVDRFAVLLPLFHSYMLTVGLLLPLA